VELRSTPKLQTSGYGEMVEPSMVRRKSPTLLSRFLGATTMSSVLLLFILSRFDDVQFLFQGGS